ncbi:MAG: hypothetical protein U0573_13130 [Phycisphaerales bacterium]|nr:hypothetical protein [Planctomycetota bacterium]
MSKTTVSALALLAAAGLGSSANAAFTMTQQSAPAPTYSTVLNFDAPGSPTGTVASNSWLSLGVESLFSGVDSSSIDIVPVSSNPGFGWLGSGNTAVGPFGVYMKFTGQVSSLSAQYWDDSGPGSFFGGGAGVILYKNGVQVDFLSILSPAYSPTGKSWINIVGSGGSTFDEVDFVGFGFSPTAYVDNISWNSVPAPSAAALLALSGLVAGRRRRA